MEYALVGSGDQEYRQVNGPSSSATSSGISPPRFSVYQDGQLLGSGAFEYGGGGTCAYSWRVPATTKSGRLKVVATQRLGDVGTNQSEPVFIDWQWYYNVPGAMLASVLLLLALVTRRNRTPSAWLIFVVPLSMVGFFALVRWLVPSIAELHDAGHFMTTLAMAWTCVWLVGHWFGTGRLPRVTVAVLGVMLAAGLTAVIVCDV